MRYTKNSTNEFTRISKLRRLMAVDAGIVRTVAEETSFTRATVSRTFAGRIDTPNPVIAEALNRFLVEAGIIRRTVA